jgi:hypothetical protein
MRWTSCAADRRRGPGEAGATIVEFLAVTILTVVCLLGLAQMAVWVWARNVAVSAAHEGARTAAERGRSLGDGTVRTRAVLRDGIGGAAAGFAIETRQEGDAVTVEARGGAPVLVPFLPVFSFSVQASAFDEDVVLR